MNYCHGLRKIIIALTGDSQVWRKVAKIRLRRFQAWRRGVIIRDSEYDSCCIFVFLLTPPPEKIRVVGVGLWPLWSGEKRLEAFCKTMTLFFRTKVLLMLW